MIAGVVVSFGVETIYPDEVEVATLAFRGRDRRGEEGIVDCRETLLAVQDDVLPGVLVGCKTSNVIARECLKMSGGALPQEEASHVVVEEDGADKFPDLRG